MPHANAAYTIGDVAARGEALKPVTPEENDGKKFWAVDDKVKLHYFTAGHGPKPLLYIHGGLFMPPMCLPPAFKTPEEGGFLSKELAEQYTVYFFHHRGCGLSTKPVNVETLQALPDDKTRQDSAFEAYGLVELVADIERIRQHVSTKSDGKISLVGFSMGGFLATCYATEFPQFIEKIIFVSNVAGNMWNLDPATEAPIPGAPSNPTVYLLIKKYLEKIEDPKTKEEQLGALTSWGENWRKAASTFNIAAEEYQGLVGQYFGIYMAAVGQYMVEKAKKEEGGKTAVSLEELSAAFQVLPHDIMGGAVALTALIAGQTDMKKLYEDIKKSVFNPETGVSKLVENGATAYTIMGKYDWFSFQASQTYGAGLLGFPLAEQAKDGETDSDFLEKIVAGPATILPKSSHMPHAEGEAEDFAKIFSAFFTA